MSKFAAFLPALGLLLAISCGNHPVEAPRAQGRPTPVSTATAREQTRGITFRSSGTVRGKNTAVLSSKTSGYVRSVHVRPGDAVRLGQVLVELEANDVRAAVTRARAALSQALDAKAEAENAVLGAHAAATLARSTHERSATLRDQKVISEQQFEDDEARLRGAVAAEEMANARKRQRRSGIDEAEAALAEAEATLAYAKILAPFAGRVLERKIEPGALASPGTEMLVLADEGVVRVEAPISESLAAAVKIGDAVSVEVRAGEPALTGNVAEIVPSVDVTSRAFLSKIDLPPGTPQIRPGSYVRVSFAVGSERVLVVPTTAISSFGALDRVFVIEDHVARLRMITRGDIEGTHTRVLSGLAANETIVVEPPTELRDGSLVEAVK